MEAYEKIAIQRAICVMVIIIVVFFLGVSVEKYWSIKDNRFPTTISEKDVNIDKNKLPKVSVEYYEGRWQISGRMKTNCGEVFFITQSYSTYREAVDELKEKQACYNTCKEK